MIFVFTKYKKSLHLVKWLLDFMSYSYFIFLWPEWMEIVIYLSACCYLFLILHNCILQKYSMHYLWRFKCQTLFFGLPKESQTKRLLVSTCNTTTPPPTLKQHFQSVDQFTHKHTHVSLNAFVSNCLSRFYQLQVHILRCPNWIINIQALYLYIFNSLKGHLGSVPKLSATSKHRYFQHTYM